MLLLRAGSPPLDLLCCCVRPAQHTPHMWRSSSAQSVTKIARRQRNSTSFSCTPDAIVRRSFGNSAVVRLTQTDTQRWLCLYALVAIVVGVRWGGVGWGGLGWYVSWGLYFALRSLRFEFSTLLP